MKRLALLAALLACWAAPVLAAAPALVANLGQASNASLGTTVSIISGATDCPVGDFIVMDYAALTISAPAATDTSGNTYHATSIYTFNTSSVIGLLYANVTADLPGSCTLTSVTYASASSLVVTSGGTCSVTDHITAGMSLAGGVTAGTTVDTGGCTLVAGAGTCPMTGNAVTCASACATVTVAAVIKPTWTGTAKNDVSAACFSGVATSSPLDVTGAGSSSTGTSASLATGTLSPNTTNDLVIGVRSTVSSSSAYASNSPFTDLTSIAPQGSDYPGWGYDGSATSAGVTYAPSWITSRVYGVNVWAFKDAASGGAVVCRRALTGVGC